MKIGIEAIQYDIPKLYLPIPVLAEARGIEAEKLQKGLGLERMAVADVHQDAVVFGANALRKLLEQEQLQPQDFHRIYVGTESGVDGSKPIASYLISLMEQNLYSPNALHHVDVVDLTFACIGGVDALHNSLDFVKANPHKKAIVVCTDIAKYELNSSGEYTQGAGAVAILVSAQPSILSFETEWTVSTKGVFDFFKPRRKITKSQLGLLPHEDWFGVQESEIEIFKEEPVFDGQYSNKCYIERTSDAYFQLKKILQHSDSLYNHWKAICMHLPYCFQARRVFSEMFVEDTPSLKWEKEQSNDPQNFMKEVARSFEYTKLVQEKIVPTEWASGKIGNMYTASIFMGMLSALSYFYEEKTEIAHHTLGFIAYGSGSKAKAFEGIIQQEWKSKIEKIQLFNNLNTTTSIDINTYSKLHLLTQKESVVPPKKEFILSHIETEKETLLGARYYNWVD